MRYAQSEIVPCYPPGGEEARCPLANLVGRVDVFYSDAPGDGDDALAAIQYEPDFGNAAPYALVLFRKGTVDYEPNRSIYGVAGFPIAARFINGAVIVSTTTLSPGDPHCCASGRTEWTVDIQSGLAAYRSGFFDPKWNVTQLRDPTQ